MKKIFIAALALVASACANHSSVPQNLTIGMSKQQVEKAWGSPCRSCRGTRINSWGDSWQYQWYQGRTFGYKNKYVFFDRKGRVTGWSTYN